MDKGAHFYRSDFQVHTPRDTGWVGARPATDADRRDFADKLVAACRQSGIKAIAITDHHDFAYFPIVKEAAQREVGGGGQSIPADQQLVVFPGIELTLGVPCQALLIFDAAFPVDRLSVVLEALALGVVDPNEPSLPPVVRADHIHSLKQLHEELDRQAWLRGAYIVLPNVTDGGHGTLMRVAMQSKYKEMPCVGGYLDGKVTDKVGEGNRRIFSGEDAPWGNKRIALFQTSDSRTESFADLGKNSTWVKWSVPTAEALRQACLAQESRISQEPPALPTVFVTRLSVSNSKFMGPIELELNPQYNAFIGGRGTGKSSCLEYLRWALCDQPAPGLADDEVADPAARRQRLISMTLAPFDGHVDIHFLLNGIHHIVRRHASTGAVLLKVGTEEFASAREEDVRSLLPIHAYSQKQLSSVSVRLDELTRFVTSPIRSELDRIDAQAAVVAGRLRGNYVSLQRQRALQASIRRNELTSRSLLQQAANLRDSLGVVSDDDRALLAQKPGYDAADEVTASWTRKLEQAAAESASFGDRILSLQAELRSVADDAPEKEALKKIEAALKAALDDLRETADRASAIVKTAQAADNAYSRAAEEWKRARADFETKYSAAKQRSAAHKTKLDELTQVEVQGRNLRESLDRDREELAGLGDPASVHAALRSEWLRIREERSGSLREQCNALTSLSGGLIRATLIRGAGLGDMAERFRTVITGSGLRTAKVELFFDHLVSENDPLAAWEDVLSELEPVHAQDGPNSTRASFPTLARLGLTGPDQERVLGRLSPDSWLDLALAPVDDHPVFEYRTKEAEYMQFSNASAGQQATALLRVLLNQSGPPLIIDQPEEDLDSQVMLQIVEQIWAAKMRRQLVFASHNPNLVVNGDAELVICCDYRAAGDHSGGRIKLQGAIDLPDVRREITSVMEGGEKAFRLRKEKYGF